jgi:hypothetical protein
MDLSSQQLEQGGFSAAVWTLYSPVLPSVHSQGDRTQYRPAMKGDLGLFQPNARLLSVLTGLAWGLQRLGCVLSWGGQILHPALPGNCPFGQNNGPIHAAGQVIWPVCCGYDLDPFAL